LVPLSAFSITIALKAATNASLQQEPRIFVTRPPRGRKRLARAGTMPRLPLAA
jgi:hypothetical protein